MFPSTVVYAGLVIATAGLLFVVKPIRRLRVATRETGLGEVVPVALSLSSPDDQLAAGAEPGCVLAKPAPSLSVAAELSASTWPMRSGMTSMAKPANRLPRPVCPSR